jgi:hypothetical protein
MQTRSERLDLVVKRATAFRFYKEIHVEPFAIDVAENMHQPCLYAAAIHAAHDMQNANGSGGHCAAHSIRCIPVLISAVENNAHAEPNA